MAPLPYSDRASLPNDITSNDLASGIPTQVLSESPSPSTLSTATTPSPPPPPQEVIVTESYVDPSERQDENAVIEMFTNTPCYPTPGDIMPYDHSLPDFIRQITNQQNLANLHSLSLRVISTLISLHRMSTYLPNLRELDLQGSVLNSLRDIGCNLKNLQILKVGRCQLESLDGTFGLSSLRELYAEKNLINDVSPCSNLPHIRHIDVSGNRIRNISYAGFLSVCSKLRSIVFAGNPATELLDYRKHVRRILPQIEILDNVSFNSEDEPKPSETIESFKPETDDSFPNDDHCSLASTATIESNIDSLLSHKKTKNLRNEASQDHFESGKTASELKGKINHLELISNNSFEKKAEQNDTSIKKMTKDIENRSKKTTSNTKEKISTEVTQSKSDNEDENYVIEQKIPTQSTSVDKENNYTPLSTMASNCLDKTAGNGTLTGTLKKRSQSPALKIKTDYKVLGGFEQGDNKLTTGLPVCGNLTAALRNRKRNQTAWNENQRRMNSESASDSDCSDELTIPINGPKDKNDVDRSFENENNLIEEDVLASSRKWREAFRRFRSNNRGVWEEEDHNGNYSDLLKDTFEKNLSLHLETPTRSENCLEE